MEFIRTGCKDGLYTVVDGCDLKMEEIFRQIGRAGEELLNMGYRNIRVDTPLKNGKICVVGYERIPS